MGTTTNITLAKALKERAKLVSNINKLYSQLGSNNSVMGGNTPDYDAIETLAEIRQSTGDLVKLKAAIAEANVRVNHIIYAMAENKTLIQYLKQLDTKNGMYSPNHRYGGGESPPVIYTAALKQRDVDQKIAEIEKELQGQQDSLDEFNHKTTIPYYVV